MGSPQDVCIDLLVASEADDLAAHRLQQGIPVRPVMGEDKVDD